MRAKGTAHQRRRHHDATAVSFRSSLLYSRPPSDPSHLKRERQSIAPPHLIYVCLLRAARRKRMLRRHTDDSGIAPGVNGALASLGARRARCTTGEPTRISAALSMSHTSPGTCQYAGLIRMHVQLKSITYQKSVYAKVNEMLHNVHRHELLRHVLHFKSG